MERRVGSPPAHNVTGDNPLFCGGGGSTGDEHTHAQSETWGEGGSSHTPLLIQRNRFIRHLSLQPHAASLLQNKTIPNAAHPSMLRLHRSETRLQL